MTCEPADRQDGGGRGRGTRGREARSPFVTPGERQRPAPSARSPGGVAGGGPGGGQKVQPGRESPAGADQGCTGGLGSQPPPPPAAPGCPRRPSERLRPSRPTLLLSAGGCVSESCAENPEVGEKRETCNRPGRGREGRSWGGEGRGGESSRISELCFLSQAVT